MKITEESNQPRLLGEYTILSILQTSPNKVFLLGRTSRGAHRPKGSRRRERSFTRKLLSLVIWVSGALLFHSREEIRKTFESKTKQNARRTSRQTFLKAVTQAQRSNRMIPEPEPSDDDRSRSITLLLYPRMELREKYNRMRFIREGMTSCPSILVSFSHNFHGRTVKVFFKRTAQFNLWDLQKAIDHSRVDEVFLP